MNTDKLKDVRQRLSVESETLILALKRAELAANEIKLEHTEDEGDLATISHDRDVLYNLHEGSFVRLKSIQAAIKAIDSGEYGECKGCEEPISEKRLEAMPWATMCIRCQEAAELEDTVSRAAMIGADEAE